MQKLLSSRAYGSNHQIKCAQHFSSFFALLYHFLHFLPHVFPGPSMPLQNLVGASKGVVVLRKRRTKILLVGCRGVLDPPLPQSGGFVPLTQQEDEGCCSRHVGKVPHTLAPNAPPAPLIRLQGNVYEDRPLKSTASRLARCSNPYKHRRGRAAKK